MSTNKRRDKSSRKKQKNKGKKEEQNGVEVDVEGGPPVKQNTKRRYSFIHDRSPLWTTLTHAQTISEFCEMAITSATTSTTNTIADGGISTKIENENS